MAPWRRRGSTSCCPSRRSGGSGQGAVASGSGNTWRTGGSNSKGTSSTPKWFRRVFHQAWRSPSWMSPNGSLHNYAEHPKKVPSPRSPLSAQSWRCCSRPEGMINQGLNLGKLFGFNGTPENCNPSSKRRGQDAEADLFPFGFYSDVRLGIWGNRVPAGGFPAENQPTQSGHHLDPLGEVSACVLGSWGHSLGLRPFGCLFLPPPQKKGGCSLVSSLNKPKRGSPEKDRPT